MAHTVGAIGLQLTAGGRTIVTVEPGPVSGPHRSSHPSRPTTVDPCGFRIAVARAWNDHLGGQEVGVVGLDDCSDLAIGWRVSSPGALLGFGAVRAPCADRMVWAFASLLSPDELGGVVRGLHAATSRDGGEPAAPDGLAARLVRDDLLDATVVHVEADRPGTATTRMLDEVVRRMLAAVAAAELVNDLAAAHG